MNFDIFDRNVTDKASNQKHFIMPNAKIALSLKCCISALPEFNQMLNFFNLFDSRLILTLLYDSLSLVIKAFSNRDYRGAWFRRKELDSAAAVGLCCTHNAPVRCLLGFLFCKVMQKHQIDEMGKQSIV